LINEPLLPLPFHKLHAYLALGRKRASTIGLRELPMASPLELVAFTLFSSTRTRRHYLFPEQPFNASPFVSRMSMMRWWQRGFQLVAALCTPPRQLVNSPEILELSSRSPSSDWSLQASQHSQRTIEACHTTRTPSMLTSHPANLRQQHARLGSIPWMFFHRCRMLVQQCQLRVRYSRLFQRCLRSRCRKHYH
jgi:hypothetical protein